MPLEKRPAFYTHDRIHQDGGHLYYFACGDRANPPYKRQITVEAILDIAADGTLAGVELIDYRMPPPSERRPDRPEQSGPGGSGTEPTGAVPATSPLT